MNIVICIFYTLILFSICASVLSSIITIIIFSKQIKEDHFLNGTVIILIMFFLSICFLIVNYYHDYLKILL